MKGEYPKEQFGIKSKGKSTQKSLSITLAEVCQCRRMNRKKPFCACRGREQHQWWETWVSSPRAGTWTQALVQLDTKQHLGTASELTQLQKLPAAPDSPCQGGSTRPHHRQAMGVSETSGDLQFLGELQHYPVPPPKPLQTPAAPGSAVCCPQSASHHPPQQCPEAHGPSACSHHVTQEQSTYGLARGS